MHIVRQCGKKHEQHGTVNQLFGSSIPLLNLPLPIGISFYTFQTMSYTIDCYRGEAKVQKNILDFGVFVTMFPQLIAGPIVKYRDVEEQLHRRKPDIMAISYGCCRFITGLAKKVLLANNLGLLWTEISGKSPAEITVLGAWLGVVAYAFQIYFDFSGYSDMAIGLGAILGFRFPENFHQQKHGGGIIQSRRSLSEHHIQIIQSARSVLYGKEHPADQHHQPGIYPSEHTGQCLKYPARAA